MYIPLHDFHYFCLPILAQELSELEYFNVPDFHFEIYDKLQENSRLQLITAPVGFAKSSLLKIFAVYEILVKKNPKFVLYVSSTDKKATEHLGAITKLLAHKELMILYNYKIISNNNHEIIIEFLNTQEQFKVEAVASGSDIAGKNFESIRPELIVVDDLEDFDQARSIDRTNALEDWLFTILIARLPSLDTGRIRMINTVLTLNSITNRIVQAEDDKYKDWDKLFVQALDKNDKSIWEERFPTEALHKERELRPLSFFANYMNEPLDLSESLIKLEELS